MKAAVLKGPGLLDLEDLPVPECPKGGALLDMKACAVCGTDFKMMERGHRDLAYPRILGHEMVGEVAEIDSDCGPVEGELVQVWPGIACGRCRSCRCGEDHRCQEIGILGFNCDGGFAEQAALPRQCIPRGLNLLPEGIDPAILSLAEPLACCINGQEQARVSKGDRVLIFGGGPVGCLHALLAELRGAGKVTVVERLEHRIREIERHTSATAIVASGPAGPAREAGHDRTHLDDLLQGKTGADGADVILMATPEVGVDGGLLRLLAPGGRICVFCGPDPENGVVPLDLKMLHYRELTISGAYGCSSRQNTLAAELLAKETIDALWIITMRTALANIMDAFSHSSSRAGLKSVICR